MARVDKDKVQEEPTAGISPGELDLEILEDEDRFIRVPVNYYRVTGDGDLNEFAFSAWTRYPIRSQLPIPTMTSLMRLEARINEAMASDDDDVADTGLQLAIEDSYKRIVSIIVERTPRAFAIVEMDAGDGVAVKVRPQVELDTTQILATLAWISGDVTVADAVARTVTAGRSKSKTAEELLADADEAADEELASEVEPSVPFPLSAS